MRRNMEEHLDMTLKEVLPIMQEAILNSKYFGVTTGKSPTDFWVYQEIINEVKPDVIIEIGNQYGGSTLALAHILDNLKNDGIVIGLDINHKEIPSIVREHPKILLIEGDACKNIHKVKKYINKDAKVLIIEDSEHTYENTLKVLRTFNSLVTEGSYFIVEDSNSNHGLEIEHLKNGNNPYEAINTFMDGNKDFIIDRTKERFMITWNVRGYLKRIKEEK